MIMDIEKPGEGFQLADSDPFLLPDWRRQDAHRLVNGEEPEWSSDDPAILKYVAYLQSTTDGSSGREQAGTTYDGSAIHAAHAMAQQGGLRRWELQSRVLANQPVEEIADRIGMAPAEVGWFESLFFDVRVRLGAEMWIHTEVIGAGLRGGFQDAELGSLWASCGYYGGIPVLDAVVGAFHSARRPGEPAALNVYLRADAGIDRRIQAMVAGVILPPYGSTGQAWMVSHAWLLEAAAADDQDRRALLRERALDWLVRCARAYLAGKPLPRPRGRQHRPDERKSVMAQKACAAGMSTAVLGKIMPQVLATA